MKKKIKSIIKFNIALLMMASAAPLGSYISLPPESGIWSRCFLASITLILYTKFTGVSIQYNYKKHTISFMFCALMQGIHWVTYFYALQMAGAGLGVMTLFTFPIFTALLEPLLLKTLFSLKYLFLTLLIVLGLYILTPEFSIGNRTTIGVLFGIISAICFAIRNILMKKYVAHYSAIVLMVYQNAWIVIFLSPFLFFINFDFTYYKTQIPYLLFLGIISTAIGHTYLVKTLKHFSATATSLLSCIQPIYVIFLAYVFLDEKPTFSTLIGGGIIISTVVLEAFFKSET